MPGLPVRALLLGLVAVFGSGYALVRYYTRRATPPATTPATREIPAPELLPADR
ncbi:MAG: hypothetical protein ACLQVI_06310 [Polyangiaceae bacterium]